MEIFINKEQLKVKLILRQKFPESIADLIFSFYFIEYVESNLGENIFVPFYIEYSF